MPSLEFTLMVGCPLKCAFCPQDALRSSYGGAEKYMSLDTFRAVLARVPRHIRIDFAGMAEPWANPAATAMLREALEDDRTVAIYTTLYGMPDDAADLIEAHASQIEVLCLHLPDANSNMRGWKYSAAYEANLLRFLALRPVLPRFEAMTMDGSGRVHADLAHIGIELGGWIGHTRAGNVNAPKGQDILPAPRHHAAVMCSFTPFYDQNVVLPNGDVVLCCMDYSVKHRIGNLLEQDYYDVFAGPEMGALRAENMRPEFSEASLCKTCDRARPLGVGAAKQFWR
jgi:sulfatase maturation enzyme AslB (radical SAM superfamily)